MKVFLKKNIKDEISDDDINDLDFMINKHLGGGGGLTEKTKVSIGRNSPKKNISRQAFRGNQRKPNRKFTDHSKSGKINPTNNGNPTNTTVATAKSSSNKSAGEKSNKTESTSEIRTDGESTTVPTTTVTETLDSINTSSTPNSVDNKNEP